MTDDEASAGIHGDRPPPPSFGTEDLRTLLDHATDGFFVLDPAQRIVEVNERLCEILRQPRSSLLGRDLLQVATDRSRAIMRQHLERVPTTPRRSYQLEARRGDGSVVTLLVRAITRRNEHGAPIGSMGFITDLSDLIEAQQATAASERELRGILDNVQDTFYRIDVDGVVIRASPSVERLLGYAAKEVIGRRLADLYVEPAEHERFLHQLRAHGGELRHFESRLRHKAGHEVYVSTHAQYWRGDDRRIKGVEGFARGVDDLRQVRSELRLAAEVLRSAAEAIVLTDAGLRIISVNPAFLRLSGYVEADVIGRPLSQFIADPNATDTFERLQAVNGSGGNWNGEVLASCAQGQGFPAWLSLSTLRDEAGRVTHRVAMYSDITERKTDQARIEFLAHHDPLTELPNRLLFRARVEQAIAQARRGGTRVALLFIDLDDFKEVNDRHGHAVGDRVLREIACRLSGAVRACDTVCRHGGDEFLVALTAITDPGAATSIAEGVVREVGQPIDVEGQSLRVGCTIGVAVFPEHGEDCETLLRSADAAMYAGKTPGSESASSAEERAGSLASPLTRGLMPPGA